MVCRIPQHRWDERDLPDIRVRRDRIREVRVDRRNGANALMGVRAVEEQGRFSVQSL
jgi:hypothetical protein